MKHFILSLLLFVGVYSHAQEEISGFFYPNLLQSGQLNPAFSTGDRFNIGLGSTYYHLDIRGPRFSQLFKTNQVLKALATATSNIYISNDASINLIDVAFPIKNWEVRFGYNSNFNGYFNFSPDLALFFSKGNEVGETFDLGPELYLTNYTEAYVGGSTTLSDQYKIGFNLKFLQGGFDFSTRSSLINLTTNEEFYEIDVETDYLINTSYNDLDISLRGLLPFNNLASKNVGISGDFGFEYLGEGWKVSTSLLDIGFIEWRNNPRNFITKAKYSFDGFTFEDISKDSINVEWDEVTELFQVGVDNKRYRTPTPLKLYVGGEYQLNRWVFGGLIYTEWKQQRVLPSFAINAKTTLWKFWDVGMMYGIKNSTFSNLGITSIMNLGPIQLYALSDNVIGIFLNLNKTKVNFRVGANINIHPKKIKEPQVEYRS